ncbi:MAG: isoprenylcysteine carboxylmethyltransferase family protein [Deltaproteobacteria bacterium]|nr:isoprenylcysteine carboxylmethyltransferase family protein [Deltaproteobacteria bacterium]
MSVNTKAWFGLIFLAAVMCIMLFVPAGTVYYLPAWVYLAIFFGASILITIYLIKYDPELLRRRVSAGPTAEQKTTQKIIMLFAMIGFVALLVVPALDYRFGWSRVPIALIALGDVLVAAGFYIVFLVYRENTFTSATIEIMQDQKVISSGPYAIVRHPMYAGGLLLLLGMPLALSSYWGLLAFVAMTPILLLRLYDEETFLCKHLSGYIEYQRKVPSRIIPGVF